MFGSLIRFCKMNTFAIVLLRGPCLECATMKFPYTLILAAGLVSVSYLFADHHAVEEGFVKIFDGESFDGWKKATENPGTWVIEDGALVAKGERSHLFYEADKPFKNFELKVDVMTKPNSNGGIYFHTKYQKTGWPKAGFECQVNVSHKDYKKTGSLYDVVNVGNPPVEDNKWWEQHIRVMGNVVQVFLDGKLLIEYKEKEGTTAGKDFGRKISEGTFALQAHDPKSIVYFKNIRVKRLPDEEEK